MRWVGHVAHTRDVINASKIIFEKCEGRKVKMQMGE